ncbi:UrcA family protein [Phenylobacterium sp.]|uniref:UrcA family protein n=1 Tax=Phenylobacterium sp. TaxID=1871053 RepID=UPI0035B0C8B9
MFQILASALAALAASAAAPSATPQEGYRTEAVQIGDLDLAKPDDQVRLDRRLDRAAMEVCGVYQGSLRELKLVVRQSACYRDALAEAKASLPVRPMAAR